LIGNFQTMTRLWHTACYRMLFAEAEKIDRHTGLTACVYDNFLAAESMEFDFDVGRDLWLTKSRFPKLQRDYLDFDRLEGFFWRCEKIATDSARRGIITQMHARQATNRVNGDDQHAWGNCILGFTYHGGKRWSKPTFALHSRVSYIAYLGSMDMALAYVLAREVAQRTGIEVEEMSFRWYVDSLQWHGLKCIPYCYAHGLVDDILDTEAYPPRAYPALNATRRSWLVLKKRYDDDVPLDREHNKYGPLRRMRTRFHRNLDGDPMPAVPLSSLQLLEAP
jgi:hypothetical protein